LRGIPVKVLYGVRTGGRTVSTADASVINLYNQAFFVFISGIHRADLGTRGVIAMHTGPGKKSRLHMRIFSLDIRDQFDPVDGATFRRLIRLDDSNIIFRMAGNDTSLASRAFI
jgi:hypothetical protein